MERDEKALSTETVPPEGQRLLKERPFENQFDMADMLQTAGKIELTDEQRGILFAEVRDDDVEIRPDGICYIPWMEYARRLSMAFGMKWALIPQGMPKHREKEDESAVVVWGFWLVIDGSLCGYAMGEQRYYPKSKWGGDFMSYTDACEGAKSNALMRLCKGIGMQLELWKPAFTRRWKEKYAVKYYDQRKGKELWKRIDALDDEGIEGGGDERPGRREVKKTEVERQQLIEKIAIAITGEDNKKYFTDGERTMYAAEIKTGGSSGGGLPTGDLEKLVDEVERELARRRTLSEDGLEILLGEKVQGETIKPDAEKAAEEGWEGGRRIDPDTGEIVEGDQGELGY